MSPGTNWKLRLAVVLGLFGLSCGDGGNGGDSGVTPEPVERPHEATSAFESDAILYVDIEMDSDDFDTLRYEGRTINQVVKGCGAADYEYTVFEAAATVAGTRYDNVGIRKKGYLGSLSSARPSFKIDLAEFVPGRKWDGERRLTLHNDRQDPSHTHQCMSYAAFSAAGVPTPRCSLARVSVNGVDLGIYTSVESIKKPFLERHFDDPSGDLYEGQVADFREGLVDHFEIKNHEEENDGARLRLLVEALEQPDDELLGALEPLLDVEYFMTFWATELLTAHWDGYSGDLNNFFLYDEPGAGFQFIPWGTDGTYSEHAFLPAERPQSVYASGVLARRLYDLPETRTRYRERLRELLTELWDESALLAEVDRLEALLGADAQHDALEAQRDWIRSYRDRVLAELDGEAPEWPFELPDPEDCEVSGDPIKVTFDTTFGDITQLSPDSTAALEIPVAGEVPDFALTFSRAGVASDDTNQDVIQVVGTKLSGEFLALEIRMGSAPLKPGRYPMQGFDTFGVVVAGVDGAVTDVVGVVGEGYLALERAGTEPGARVTGLIEGEMVPPPNAFLGGE